MTHIQQAYAGAFATYGEAAFGERTEGHAHTATLIGSLGQYTVLGLFADRWVQGYALAQTPADAPHPQLRTVLSNTSSGPVLHTEDGLAYERGIDNTPTITHHQALTSDEEGAIVRDILHDSVMLFQDAAKALRIILRHSRSIADYQRICRAARANTTLQLGPITTYMLTEWEGRD